ncbi:ATP-binding response regulator [Desulfonema magnum]|nr:response regulator [Desulfonema magnum]
MKILIVDDKKEGLYLLETLLKKGGHEVVSAANGAEALEILSAENVEMIISDILMPEMDGYQFCKNIRQDEKLKDIPFIFYSATYTDEKDEAFALKLGADRFIRKTVRPDELLGKTIQNVIKDKEQHESVQKKSTPLKDEKEIYKLYSERLVNKLEKKVSELNSSLTKQEQLNEKLKIKEYAIASSINGIAFADLDGNLTYVNQSFLDMWGYDSEEEVLGKSATKFWNSEYNGLEVIKKLYYKNKWSGEMKAKRKNGSVFDVRISANLVTQKDGRHLCMMASFRDISEQRKLEAQLRLSQKMEAIGRLAGGIAHDFNNILFIIMGYAEMIMGDFPKDSEPYNKLMKILTASKRARDLVRQILTFSRQDDTERKPLNIQPVIKESLKLLRSSISKNIEFKVNLDTDCGDIMGDPTQIHQIMMNLCTNAYHAMEETGGCLEVTLNEVVIGTDDMMNIKPGKHLRLSVHDTGKGMTSDVMEKIFEPYYTTKEKNKGTGLGLSVVHGIIKNHEGNITVYSEPDRGTTFNLYLPVIEEKSVEETISDDAVQKGSEHILLVDDEKQIVKMESQMLEALGYQVTAFISSSEALNTFRTEPETFDLVITDMAMPNMTGEKLAQQLKNIRSDIPIILCTGFSERISENRARRMGIDGYIMKPMLKNELAKKIREILD